jgi:hypothetical protein
MPLITLRTQAGVSHLDDIQVEVKPNTYEYLLTSPSPTIRVSAYFDRDWPKVGRAYAELHVTDSCPFRSEITRVTPGSRERKDIELPGPMLTGEQLTIEVRRAPIAQPT